MGFDMSSSGELWTAIAIAYDCQLHPTRSWRTTWRDDSSKLEPCRAEHKRRPNTASCARSQKQSRAID